MFTLLWTDPVTGRSILEGTSADTLPANEVTGTTVLLTDLGISLVKMGTHWVPERGGVPHPREAVALGATPVTLTWTATPLRSAVILATQEAAGTPNLTATIAVCFEPYDDTARDILLNAGDHLTADSGRILIPVNVPYQRVFTTPITKIGVKRNAGSEALTVTVLGISVA